MADPIIQDASQQTQGVNQTTPPNASQNLQPDQLTQPVQSMQGVQEPVLQSSDAAVSTPPFHYDHFTIDAPADTSFDDSVNDTSVNVTPPSPSVGSDTDVVSPPSVPSLDMTFDTSLLDNDESVAVQPAAASGNQDNNNGEGEQDYAFAQEIAMPQGTVAPSQEAPVQSSTEIFEPYQDVVAPSEMSVVPPVVDPLTNAADVADVAADTLPDTLPSVSSDASSNAAADIVPNAVPDSMPESFEQQNVSAPAATAAVTDNQLSAEHVTDAQNVTDEPQDSQDLQDTVGMQSDNSSFSPEQEVAGDVSTDDVADSAPVMPEMKEEELPSDSLAYHYHEVYTLVQDLFAVSKTPLDDEYTIVGMSSDAHSIDYVFRFYEGDEDGFSILKIGKKGDEVEESHTMSFIFNDADVALRLVIDDEVVLEEVNYAVDTKEAKHYALDKLNKFTALLKGNIKKLKKRAKKEEKKRDALLKKLRDF